MHLWTDYEGNMLAGHLVGRLKRSEGRNGFFETTGPDGQRAFLRLTEAHFNESELIGRWRSIAAVKHPNLQVIESVGQTTFEGLSLACCVLEPTESSLSDALRDHVFSVDEVREVAEAVSGVLSALHAADLIHEHVDASNVFASGEIIKLRSDCCRECVGGFEADTPEAREALRQRDVRDLGLLLLRCFGLVEHGYAPAQVAQPLDRIIAGALDGTLTAMGIVVALQPPKQSSVEPGVRPTPLTSSISRPAVPATQDMGPTISPEVVAGSSFSSGTRVSPTFRRDSTGSPPQTGPDGLPHQPRQSLGTKSIGTDIRQWFRPMKPKSAKQKAYMAAGTAAAMLGVVLWFAAGSNKSAIDENGAARVEGRATHAQTTVAAQPSTDPPTLPQAVQARDSLFVSGARAGWHVIAYTYKYEQQAQAQVMKLQQKYVSLHPQVFTPTGHAPYFVALGNPSDAATAMDMRNRARHAGLPRDTYARNF
jgi:eukaryotic-like serine/threonine-protein kinase